MEISPTEDLMREHGLLNRMFLIYDHFLIYPNGITLFFVKKVAKLIRYFVEDYHEKMEEKYIFPRVIALGNSKQKKLVKTLVSQHHSGRKLTSSILRSKNIILVQQRVKQFLTMYRAHESREDTEIFEFWRKNTCATLLKSIGEKFETSEEELLGKNGYHKILQKVISIETKLNINRLENFNP